MKTRYLFVKGDEIGIMKVLEILKEAYDNKIIANFGFVKIDK